jgi:phosphatidylinositol-3-phosphatase
MPTPNTAAVAILGMLGFGVLVGSIVGTGGTSLVSAPLLLAVSPPASHLTSSPNDAGGGSPDITVTDSSGTPAPAGSALAPASQQAATVYAPAPSTGGGGSLSAAPSNLLGLPPIKHVFLIVLSNQGYGQTFGSKDKYFATTLPKQGELIQHYYAATSGQLANGIGLISGQGPTPETATACSVFGNVTPARKGSLGQVLGHGCVYPARALTLADQLSPAKLGGWKAYVEGADQAPRGQPATCRHPALGAKDSEQVARLKDPYVTWRNPFVYFHSLIDKTACKTNDVPLTRLTSDLKDKRKTPALSYIVPSPCDDGDPQPCAPKAKSGLAAADRFLRSVLPEIEHSPAYRADGLIAITFDQAPQTGLNADPSACCDAQTFPNLPPTTTTTPTGTTTTPLPAGTTTVTTSTTSAPTTPGVTTTTTPGLTTTTTTTPADAVAVRPRRREAEGRWGYC